MMRLLALALILAAFPAFAAPTINAHITTKQGNIPLTLEVAATPETREYGLMNRTSLAPNDGMLFALPQSQRQLFWMKDTLIPLDMLFIDSHHRIIFIGTGQPRSLQPIGPADSVDAVIELDGGRASDDAIAIGDIVTYALPPDITVQ